MNYLKTTLVASGAVLALSGCLGPLNGILGLETSDDTTTAPAVAPTTANFRDSILNEYGPPAALCVPGRGTFQRGTLICPGFSG